MIVLCEGPHQRTGGEWASQRRETPPCLALASERVRRGGHDVPAADVRRRFTRSARNFWSLYRPLADEWSLDYNGADGFRRVAAGTAHDLAVYDDELTTLFHTSRGHDGIR